jgi:hypothetical protein
VVSDWVETISEVIQCGQDFFSRVKLSYLGKLE